jgi:carboxymethylenebutenolidase
MAVTTKDHTLTTADGPMRLYEAVPDGTAKGAVIVIMEAFGVNGHIEGVTRRAAEAGYHAVSPDLFHRAGGGTAGYDEFPKVMEFFKSVTDDGILIDVDAAIDHLHKAGFTDDKIGIFGFCFGGRVTFLTAARRQLGAAITYYGGGIVSTGPLPFAPLVGEAGQVKTPWMGHFGDLDKGIPVEDVEQLKAAMDKECTVDHALYRYADADHGFHCDERTAVYNKAAANLAWSRTLEWLAKHIG